MKGLFLDIRIKQKIWKVIGLYLNLISDIWIKLDKAQFTKGQRGHPILIDGRGFQYLKHKNSKINNSTIFWRCQKSRSLKCPARATTDGFHIIRYLNDHNHASTKYILETQ